MSDYFKFIKLDRSFVTMDAKTKEALLGPGEPHLPVTFIVSKKGIEAKFIGADSIGRALTWLER